MNTVCIFASGNGSNAEAIIRRFSEREDIRVALVVSSCARANVLARAQSLQTPALVVSKDEFADENYLPDLLRRRGVTHIVLAGFLWLVPPRLIACYPGRIVNIHPALLPKFGGQGMYGMRVHEAVKAAGEKETGITIHEIDERYDRGKILFQASAPVADNDTAETIASKVRALEHAHFGRVAEEWITGKSLMQ